MLDLAWRPVATTVALVGLALTLPASATFPGANGKIAFIRDLGDDEDDIFVVNVNGSGQTNLTDLSPADDEDHRWSPDGQRLVFASSRDGNDEIYVMNADGGEVTSLTDRPPTGSRSGRPMGRRSRS
jgi:Tol biopolymer transport system component